VFLRWTTHKPEGLSAKDIIMARYCDTQALVHPEVGSAKHTQTTGSPKGDDLVNQ
ncbi:hypothetical protein MMC20_004867, partial [Loxospora ochrophaea]|nr:hypothetical protein [Loxospora ochrophaea]